MKDTLDIIREHEGFPTTASKDTLLPCPFCGNKNLGIAETWNGNYHGKVVNCNYLDGGCGANSGSRTSEAEAIEAWNRRAE